MKKWLKKYLSYNQNCIAVAAVVFAAMALWYILFSFPRTGMADFGEYDQTLYRMGLSRTQTDLENPDNRYFYHVIETYEVDGVDGTRLFGQTPTESMIYPVALISMVCRMFGLPFHTTYLAFLYCVMTLCSVYLITKSLYTYLGNRVIAVPLVLGIFLFNSDVFVPFNSLYSEGMQVASGLLLVALILRTLVCSKEAGIFSMLPLIAVAYLFLTSGAAMPFLIVIVLPVLLYLIYRRRPALHRILYYYVASGLGCLLLLAMCVQFMKGNEQLGNSMNLHSATFNGLFVAAEDKEEAIAYFGLPEEYLEDIGKSYYLAEDAYVVAPYSEEAQEAIYSHISYGKILGYYLSHPKTFWNLLDSNLATTGRIDTERYLYIERDRSSNPDVNVERLGYYPFFRGLLVPRSTGTLLAFMGIALAGILGMLIYKIVHKQNRGSCYLMFLMMGLCLGSLLSVTILYGNFESSTRMFPYMLFFDGFAAAMTIGIIWLVIRLADFMEERTVQITEPSYVAVGMEEENRLKKWGRQGLEWLDQKVWNHPVKGAVTVGLLAGLIMFLVCFVPDRIGAYNNGDFGRMMDAMGLYYTDYDLLHQDEQYVTKVIEEYVWLDTFDWTSVTSINPTMSQVFLAVFIRLTAGAMGLNYSTVYATVIYLVLMTLSYIFMTMGLRKLLGKKALWLSGILIVVLFGSYNMGWFNSLFGEATSMAGFLMVMGSSLFILAQKRGRVRWYQWLALIASIRFFVGAKSQMTPEIILWGIWAIVLAVYHKPVPVKKEQQNENTVPGEKSIFRCRLKWSVQILAVVIMILATARSAVIIYQKDGAISSQDQIYASIFTGVLMVADDPIEALRELGLDESLVADRGKHQYLGDGAYYCQPRTQMAEEMIYSKVNTFDILGWYLKHPLKLLYVLDYSATQSAARMPDYFLYVGEKTTEAHRTVSKFNIWGDLRGSITPTHFWQYVLLYGVMMIICLGQIFSKRTKLQKKLLAGFYILVILSGALQFPLSVIGNGFVDNVKQLYMFRLIHDIIITGAAFYMVIWCKKLLEKETGKLLRKKGVDTSTESDIMPEK